MLKRQICFANTMLPLIVAAAFFLLPSEAFAQTPNIGNMISTVGRSITNPFIGVIILGSIVTGVALIASGLLRLTHMGEGFKEHGTDGLMRIVGGSMLAAMPASISVAIQSFYGSNVGQLNVSSAVAGNPSSCITTGSLSSLPLTCVAQNIGVNVVPVFISITFAMMFIVGAFSIGHGIYTMAMSHSVSGRGNSKGFLSKIAFGALFCNLPWLTYAIEQTLGIGSSYIALDSTGYKGVSGSSVNAALAYSGPAGVTGQAGAVLAQYTALIGWLFVILSMFGVIAIWRGLSHLKSLSEGGHQTTVSGGITHIIGGVLLVNGKWTVCLVTSTAFGSNFLGFCS